jgi:NAD(P)-dependent dehydrogenase (short-subunit alcohol dehydrogenase family)
VVEQAVEQCRGDDGIAKDFAPFGEAAVRSEDHRAFLVAGVDKLEEQIAAALHDRQVTDLVDDEKGGAGEEPQTLAQRAFAFGLCEGGDDVGERGERDALSSLHGLDRERRREMALAGTAKGSIVNIASMNAALALPRIPAYCASKGGVVMLTKALALAWAEDGIRVNAVAPGYIETAINAAGRTDRAHYQRITERTAFKRWGQPVFPVSTPETK